MAITVASSAITIIDTTDNNQLSAYLTSNLSTVQTCTSNGNVYTPNWEDEPNLRIQLHAFYNQTEINYSDKNYKKTWYFQDGSGDRVQIEDPGTLRTLVITKNNLGASKSGMLTYTCRVELDDVNYVEAQITYTLVTESKNVVFSVYAPDGTIFLNQSGELKLATHKYYGATEITSGATFQWYKYTNSNWNKISGAIADTLTVSGSDVLNIASYKCIMTYKSVEYVGTITLQDKSDPYISEIYTVGGNIFKNGIGGCATYITVRSNGKEVDPLTGPVSTTAPSDAKEGDYWYKIDDENNLISQQRFSSKDVWYEMDSTTTYKEIPQTLKYIWSLLDKNGNKVTFKDGSAVKLGKVIYMSCDDIQETGTLQCDVRKAGTLKITTQPQNLTVAPGSKVKFSVVAESKSNYLYYLWQRRKDASSSWKDVYTTATTNFEATSAHNGYQYRCRIKDGSEDIVYSYIVTLTVT